MEFVVNGKTFYNYEEAQAYEKQLDSSDLFKEYLNKSYLVSVLGASEDEGVLALVLTIAETAEECKALSKALIEENFGYMFRINEETMNTDRVYHVHAGSKHTISDEKVIRWYFEHRHFGLDEMRMDGSAVVLLVADKITEERYDEDEEDDKDCENCSCKEFCTLKDDKTTESSEKEQGSKDKDCGEEMDCDKCPNQAICGFINFFFGD